MLVAFVEKSFAVAAQQQRESVDLDKADWMEDALLSDGLPQQRLSSSILSVCLSVSAASLPLPPRTVRKAMPGVPDNVLGWRKISTTAAIIREGRRTH